MFSTSSHISIPTRAKAVRQQSGFTIVELSIAVAIAGILLVSAIGLVQTVLLTNRANETVTILSRTMAQIDKTWADQPDYNGISLAAVGATGAFNGMQETRNAAGEVIGVTSKFNRPVFAGLLPNLPATALNRGFFIRFAAVPVAVCSDLVTAAASAGVRGILITPEANTNTTTAGSAYGPSAMAADGTFTVAAGTAIAMDATRTTPNLATVLSTAGCGTNQASVALTFVNWK